MKSNFLYQDNNASEAATGAKTMTQEEKRMVRENLQLAEMFPRQPEKLPIYMQQHLLENPVASEPETEPPVV